MIDLKSVVISGALKAGRCRALWNNGRLRAYNKRGHRIIDTESTEPKPRKGWRNTLDALTPSGPIMIESKCQTCMRPWPVSRIDAEALWDG